MNITVDKKDCSAKIAIEIPADKVAAQKSDIVKAYSKQANIKGFRQGKAPAKVIEKRFASDIKDELEQRLINKAITEAIKDEKLKVLNVKVSEAPVYGDDQCLKVEAVATLAPEFELPDYKEMEIEAASNEISDEEVDKSLKELSQRFAEYKDTDGALEQGQFAVIDFTSNIDGKEVEEVIGKSAGFVGGREGQWVKIEEDAFLPGFVDEIKGLKTGDKKVIPITITDDFPIEALRGQTVNFDITVKETKEQSLPEINDEFAAKLLPDENLEKLKEMISEQLQSEKSREIADSKVEQIMEKLNDAVSFNLPEEILQAEIQNNLQGIVKNAIDRGMDQKQLEEQKEEIEAQAKEQAETTLRSNFILQEIAAAEKIEADDQDLIGRISQMADAAQKPVKAYLKELQKSGRIENVRNSVLVGKTIDFLVASAKVTITEPQAEEDNA